MVVKSQKLNSDGNQRKEIELVGSCKQELPLKPFNNLHHIVLAPAIHQYFFFPKINKGFVDSNFEIALVGIFDRQGNCFHIFQKLLQSKP